MSCLFPPGRVTAGCALAVAFLAACSRHAEIREDQAPSLVDLTHPPRPDSGIPLLDELGLTAADGGACRARPSGTCTGTNDFPCAGEEWLEATALACRAETRCRAGDWVSVEFGEDGCVVGLGMLDPEDAFVACLVGAVQEISCPCYRVTFEFYLGVAGAGCGEPGG